MNAIALTLVVALVGQNSDGRARAALALAQAKAKADKEKQKPVPTERLCDDCPASCTCGCQQGEPCVCVARSDLEKCRKQAKEEGKTLVCFCGQKCSEYNRTAFGDDCLVLNLTNGIHDWGKDKIVVEFPNGERWAWDNGSTNLVTIAEWISNHRARSRPMPAPRPIPNPINPLPPDPFIPGPVWQEQRYIPQVPRYMPLYNQRSYSGGRGGGSC